MFLAKVLLKDYKIDILEAIKETKELNARIYIQVLDNCLEWLNVKETLDEKIIRVLVLGTFNFVLNHMILDYQEVLYKSKNIRHGTTTKNQKYAILEYNTMNFYSSILKYHTKTAITNEDEYIKRLNKISEKYFLQTLKLEVTKVNGDKNSVISDKNQEEHLNWIKENKQKLKALWKYGYRLYYVADVEEKVYNEIAKFIKSGILI